MSTLAKGLTILAVVLAIGTGLLVWKIKVGGTHGGGSHGDEAVTKLTKEEMQLLFKDANPMALKQLAENPELKQKQVESIKEFLAVANQARKEGLTKDPKIKTFLEFIRAQIVATNYDREKNKDKNLPPFSFIKKEDIENFYKTPANEEQFNELVNAIKEQGKEEGEEAPDPTPEQLQQLKEQYAKVKIYEHEAEGEEGKKLGEEFERKTNLQVRLQQAAFLNQLYAQKVMKDKVKITDEEVQQYIAAHPELDPKNKRAKAEEILQRAKGGEDFAKLAKEFSEDPGSKENGGLYEKTTKGQMAPEFEQTALSLEPGKVADQLVETKYGFHIIKLEKKGTTKDKDGKEEETYDVRHILISTMFSDPTNPFGQPMAIEEKVKADLQEEKEKKILEEIKAQNPIVIEDFEIPAPSEEEMKQMQERMQQQMQQQMQMAPEGAEEEAAKQETQKKTETKKEK